MKIRFLLSLVGLAISFALPTFAQQTMHLRELCHVCACAIASTGVFCKTFPSEALR
jgi:hypothetical protein